MSYLHDLKLCEKLQNLNLFKSTIDYFILVDVEHTLLCHNKKKVYYTAKNNACHRYRPSNDFRSSSLFAVFPCLRWIGVCPSDEETELQNYAGPYGGKIWLCSDCCHLYSQPVRRYSLVCLNIGCSG